MSLFKLDRSKSLFDRVPGFFTQRRLPLSPRSSTSVLRLLSTIDVRAVGCRTLKLPTDAYYFSRKAILQLTQRRSLVNKIGQIYQTDFPNKIIGTQVFSRISACCTSFILIWLKKELSRNI